MYGKVGDVTDQPERLKAGQEGLTDLNKRIEKAKDFKAYEVPVKDQPPEPSAAKIEQFRRDFSDRRGAEHVIRDASEGNENDRIGASHQVDVAYELGDQIESFEEPIHPIQDGEPTRTNNIDVVTKDGYAVECKATRKAETYQSQLEQAYGQALTRLEPNIEGIDFKGVVVVFEDGKLHDNVKELANHYEAANPGLRLCEKSQLNKVLNEMRHRKA
jgi:hypothetical protein